MGKEREIGWEKWREVLWEEVGVEWYEKKKWVESNDAEVEGEWQREGVGVGVGKGKVL